jgi:hypothetical protein
VGSARNTVAASRASQGPGPSTSTSGCEKPEPAGFAQFWERYPKRVGRKPALVAYAKAITKTSPEAIYQGLEAYIAEKEAWRAWMDPSKFLNQERWTDYSTKTTGAISPSRSEWVCRHTPHCGNRTTCAVVSSRTCEHEPLCQSREACMTRTLEGWQ